MIYVFYYESSQAQKERTMANLQIDTSKWSSCALNGYHWPSKKRVVLFYNLAQQQPTDVDERRETWQFLTATSRSPRSRHDSTGTASDIGRASSSLLPLLKIDKPPYRRDVEITPASTASTTIVLNADASYIARSQQL
jgi:hypothetical protein